MFYGIYFTLTEPQDIYVGFQANLSSGSETQEFRAEAVRLLSLPYDPPSVIRPILQTGDNGDIYDLTGRKLPDNNPSRGFYIVNGKKIRVK